MRKIYSTLLLVMAMLCIGANTAWAKDLSIQQVEWQNALAEINSACGENGFTLTFAYSYTGSATGIPASTGINIYRDGETNNYIVAPTTAGDVIKPECAGLFINCTNLTAIDFTNFDTSSATNMSGMFSFCTSLISLNLSSFDTSNVENMNGMFRCCTSLTSLDLSSFNTSKVEDMANMFDMENIDESTSSLVSITFGENFVTSNVTSMANMFNDCSSLKSLDLSNFNTSNVTTMMRMFSGCSSLQSLTLSNNFSTSKVENMYSMFYSCSGLTSLDLSSFNTSKVTNMESMFHGCGKLESLTLSSNFNTSNVTTMSCMFNGCEKLASLDLSSFNTSSVTDMWSMFCFCENLTSLDLSSFNTQSVASMPCMFYSCSNLQSLTIGNFDMSSVTNTDEMFTDCTKLNTLTMTSLPYLLDETFNTQFSGEGKTVNVELDDNSVVYTGDKTNYLPAVTSATYTRTMPTDAETGKARRWGTAVLPFYVYPNDQTGVMPYEVSNLANNGDDWTMSVERYDRGSVTAGEPFLFYNTSGAATVTFTGDANQDGYVYINTKIEPKHIDFGDGAYGGSGDYTYISWKGTYEETKIQSNSSYSLYFVAQDKFWLAEAETTVKPFRGWFELGYGYNQYTPEPEPEQEPEPEPEPDAVKSFNIVIADENTSIHNAEFILNNKVGTTKRLENNRIIILKNGKKYNTSGQALR